MQRGEDHEMSSDSPKKLRHLCDEFLSGAMLSYYTTGLVMVTQVFVLIARTRVMVLIIYSNQNTCYLMYHGMQDSLLDNAGYIYKTYGKEAAHDLFLSLQTCGLSEKAKQYIIKQHEMVSVRLRTFSYSS